MNYLEKIAITAEGYPAEEYFVTSRNVDSYLNHEGTMILKLTVSYRG